MVSCADLEFVCHICNQPMNLETDLATDERGQSLHGDCFAKQVKSAAEQRVPSSGKSAA
jgi:hypothetical protein